VRQAHPLEQLLRTPHGLLARLAEHMDGRLGDVLHHRAVRPQVEGLEHHRQSCPPALQLLRARRAQAAVAIGNQFERLVAQAQHALVRLLQQVEAAQQRALARAAGTDDGHDVTRTSRE
jgi:hypothetical protein